MVLCIPISDVFERHSVTALRLSLFTADNISLKVSLYTGSGYFIRVKISLKSCSLKMSFFAAKISRIESRKSLLSVSSNFLTRNSMCEEFRQETRLLLCQIFFYPSEIALKRLLQGL